MRRSLKHGKRGSPNRRCPHCGRYFRYLNGKHGLMLHKKQEHEEK